MINKKLYRYKPVYKKLASLKKNVQNRKKISNFRNQKWQFLVAKSTKMSNSEPAVSPPTNFAWNFILKF